MTCISPHKLIKKRVYGPAVLIKGNSLSHSPLTLLAIIPGVPAQAPFTPVATHWPLSMESPLAQVMQLFESGPLQLEHDDEQGEHVAPSGNVGAWGSCGHWTPPVVWIADCGRVHLVLSFSSGMNPCRQELQAPVPSWQLVHEISHTARIVIKKKRKKNIKSYFDNHQWRSNRSLAHTEHMLFHWNP